MEDDDNLLEISLDDMVSSDSSDDISLYYGVIQINEIIQQMIQFMNIDQMQKGNILKMEEPRIV